MTLHCYYKIGGTIVYPDRAEKAVIAPYIMSIQSLLPCLVSVKPVL